MNNKELIQKYRQLDYDLAAVHSILNSTRENKMKLFVPTESNCRRIKSELEQLKARVDFLDTDGKTVEFIKNHFYDFLHSLNMQFETARSNPQGYLYSVGWKIVPMILDAALQLITGLAQGLLNAIPVLIQALPEIIMSIILTQRKSLCL